MDHTTSIKIITRLLTRASRVSDPTILPISYRKCCKQTNIRKWEAKTEKEKVLHTYCHNSVQCRFWCTPVTIWFISELNDQIFVESELSDSNYNFHKLILRQCDCFCLIMETHIRLKERKVKPRSERHRRGRWQGRKLPRNASKQNEPSSSLTLSLSLYCAR